MNSFIIHLQSPNRNEVIDKVISFVGVDNSGSFGILPNHMRIMTCLEYGLLWFKYQNNEIEYLAVPGAILYFVDNQLFINTQYYLKNKDYNIITKDFEHEIVTEKSLIKEIKGNLEKLNIEILRQMWKLKKTHQNDI